MLDWLKKEETYADLYRAGRQATNLWKYIPKSVSGVTNAFSDSDGYWIWLDENHQCYDDGEGMIHEYTIADLKAAIKTIREGRR